MTWDAFHARGEALRAVVDEVDVRRDGTLPMELPGVSETFGDELGLLAALQLRWHTRLAGHLERALMEPSVDLHSAVLTGWRETADELVGVRMVLDAHRAGPTTAAMADALETAHGKEAVLLAAMARLATGAGSSAVAAGERIEAEARAGHHPTAPPRHRADDGLDPGPATLLGRIKARLAA